MYTYTHTPFRWLFCCAKTQRGGKSSQTILSIRVVCVNGFCFFGRGWGGVGAWAGGSSRSSCEQARSGTLCRGCSSRSDTSRRSHERHKNGKFQRDAPLLTQGLPPRFRPAWLDGMCLNHTRLWGAGVGAKGAWGCGGREDRAPPAPLTTTTPPRAIFWLMFMEAFYKLTEQFEEYIFLRGMWHFMSFIGEGKKIQYLQVFLCVFVF